MPQPIYFNGKFYGGGLNGVHRVADRLIRECDRALALIPPDQRPRAYLLTSADADWVPPLKVIERRDYARTNQIWEQVTLPLATRDGVLVNLANLAPVAHRNKITMIHDVQFLFADCGYPARQRIGYRWLTPLLGRSSRVTLTVSEFSRRMLHQHSISPMARTRVIANGADHILEAEEDPVLRMALGLEEQGYAVMFGSPKGYKNNAVAFAAFASGATGPTRLVVVGPGREQLVAAGLEPPPGTVFAGRPDDGALKGLLSGALAILFPSRTEGFGLPPLEAMLCGCPVVASPAGAIPEACGDAVLYAGTDSPGEWADALERLLTDPQLRADKIAQGRLRAARFTWSAAGTRLMAVINQVRGEAAMTQTTDNSMPDLSVDVVIPTYNRRDLLPAAIASIKAQTVPVTKIYVVDDGSTDGTIDWLREICAQDETIELIEMQHGGANRARNAGIGLARSQWVAFLDSDDAWEPDKLERQFALLDARPNLVGLFCGFRLVGGNVELIHRPRDNPSLLDLRCANALGSTSGAVIRREALQKAGGFDPQLPSCQDWDLWFRLRQTGPMGVARLPLVRFNCGPHERITTNMNKVLAGHRAIFAHLLADVDRASERATIGAQHKLVEADIKRRFGENRAALMLIVRSFLQAPSKRALAVAWRTARAMWRDGIRREPQPGPAAAA